MKNLTAGADFNSLEAHLLVHVKLLDERVVRKLQVALAVKRDLGLARRERHRKSFLAPLLSLLL